MDGLEKATGASRAGKRIDASLAARSVAMAAPLIEQAMRDPACGDSGFLHVVVMDPARGPQDCAFEQAILFERSFGGDASTWDADYASYARGKAETSWRERRDNPKGAVCIDDFVVGASGAFEPFDQAYAGAVALCLRALATHRKAAA
jgi:hypothetical protein